ncbi:hypothetical protein Dimus_029677 [Dionaea muscipula]
MVFNYIFTPTTPSLTHKREVRVETSLQHTFINQFCFLSSYFNLETSLHTHQNRDQRESIAVWGYPAIEAELIISSKTHTEKPKHKIKKTDPFPPLLHDTIFKSLPPQLILAVIAIESPRFPLSYVVQ